MAKIKATLVSTNYYVGVTTLADIRGNCPDPKRVDQSTEAQRKADPDLGRAWSQRGANQRQFNKPRIARMIGYASYIAGVDEAKILGGYPPITLWTEDESPFVDGVLEISGSTILSANDGETQLAARYALAKADPTLLDRPFAVTITTGSDKTQAMQTLHDMNHFATPVSEKETAVLNVEGALTKAINKGIGMTTRDPDLSIRKKTEKVTGGFLTTSLILLHGGVGALYGEEALRHTPNSLIKKANAQFVDLGEKSDVVSGFINEVLRLPNDALRTIGSDQMMALGARYAETSRVLAPISAEDYARLDADLKAAKGGKSRATIGVRAQALFNKLAA